MLVRKGISRAVYLLAFCCHITFSYKMLCIIDCSFISNRYCEQVRILIEDLPVQEKETVRYAETGLQ